MKNLFQAISKALVVVSLLISVFFLEGCSLEELLKLPPEQQAVAISAMIEKLNKQAEERKKQEEENQKKEAALKEEAERQRKEKEEWEKQKQQEEAERLRLEEERKQKEEKERLEQAEKERKRQEELEQAKAAERAAQRIIDEHNKKKQDKEHLDSEVKRVALILQGVANNPDQLEKKIEELTPHGKVINKAFKGNSIGHNLRLDSNEALTNTDVAILINHPRLEKIVKFDLDRLTLSKPQLKKLLHVGRLTNLQYLRFNSNLLLSSAPSLKFLPDLRYIDLSYCGLGDTGMQTLAPCFKGITYLIGLDLTGNNIGLVGAQALADHCKDLSNLRTFKLDDNNAMGLEGIQALASQLIHLAKLHALSLDNTLVRAGAAGAHTLAPHLKYLPNLRMLRLEANKLEDEGVQHLIPSLQNLPRLHTLNLADNHISSASTKWLVQYLNTVKINQFRLFLGQNQLGDAGVQPFLESLKSSKPCSIYLESCNISNMMVKKLQQLSHITWELDNPIHSGVPHHTKPSLQVDSSATNDKESILGTEF